MFKKLQTHALNSNSSVHLYRGQSVLLKGIEHVYTNISPNMPYDKMYLSFQPTLRSNGKTSATCDTVFVLGIVL